MAKPSKKELNEAVGDTLLKTAAKQMAAAAGPASKPSAQKTQELMEVIQSLSDQQIGVTLAVFRKNQFEKTPEFLGLMSNVSPELIKEAGSLHPIIKAWSGGGTYKVEVQAPGIPTITVNDIRIAGDPHEPKTGARSVTSGVPTNPADFGSAGSTTGGNPQWASILGMQKQQETSIVRDVLQIMMLKDQLGSGGNNHQPDPAVAALATQVQQLSNKESSKDMKELLEKQEQRHREDMRRMEDLIKEMNRQPAGNPTVELAAALAPVAAAFVQSNAESKSRETAAMSANMQAIMGLNENSSKQALEFATLMSQRPSAEDRVIKMSSAYADTMANMGNFFGTMINGIMAQQAGPEQPPWLQALSMLAGGATNVLQSMVGGVGQDEYEEIEVQAPDGPVQVQAPASVQQSALPSGAAAGQAARAAITEGASGVTLAQGEGQAAGMPAADPNFPPREKFDGAMQYIFDLIEEGGDMNEIVARIYKHGYYGQVQVAKGWYDNPEQATIYILAGLRARKELDVPDGQIHAVANGLIALHQYLDVEENTFETFIEETGINIRPPRVGVSQSVLQNDPSGAATGSGEFGEAVKVAPVKEIPPIPPKKVSEVTGDEELEEQDEELEDYDQEDLEDTGLEDDGIEDVVEDETEEDTSEVAL